MGLMTAMFGKAPRTRTRQDQRCPGVYAALVLATVLYCPLLFSGLDHFGRRDWDQFSFRYETPRLALLRDHQLPTWNPYVNGGTVLLAHPDSPFPSPWYLLVLALGAPVGLRVQVVLFMALGAIGMAALLRRWQVPAAGCFAGGVVFMMGAHFVLHIAEGHLEWCVLGLMPWLMLCLLRLQSDWRFVIVTGLLAASALTFGSVYIMAIYVPFFSVWVVLESVRQRSRRLVLGWSGALILMVLLSAVKLLPQLEFVRSFPRDEVANVGMSPAGLVQVFLDPRQDFLYRATREAASVKMMRDRGVSNELARSMPADVSKRIHDQLRTLGVVYEWHEYGAYITYAGCALALCGFVAAWRGHWPLYGAGLLAAITILGNGFPIDLWTLLRQLPLYRSLTVPSRFLAAVVFVLAVAVGHGLGWLCRRTADSQRRALHVFIRYAVPVAIYAELTVLGWSLFGDIFVCRPIPLPHHETFAMRYNQINTYYPIMYSYVYPLLESNSGALEGYENVQVRRGGVLKVDDVGYRGEAYLESSRHPVTIREWTMARVKVGFEVDAPDTLVLNQTYFTGWRVRIHGSDGWRALEAAANGSDLVSTAVQPGDRELEFYYLPGSFLRGAWISGIALIASTAILLVSSIRPVRPGT
jgi:hypothetical protein